MSALLGYIHALGQGIAIDPHWANVVALLHMDGTDGSTTFTDETGKSWTANGDVQIDSAQSHFGSASGLFDGAGDFVNITHSDFAFGTGDFTVECWIRPTAITSGEFDFIGSTYASNGWRLSILNNQLEFATNVINAIVGGSILNDTWYHIAFTRSGNDHKLFIDGTQVGSTYTANNNYTNTNMVIGYEHDPAGNYFNGHIDEVRITKGVARYTSNFTPPTAPFPNF